MRFSHYHWNLLDFRFRYFETVSLLILPAVALVHPHEKWVITSRWVAWHDCFLDFPSFSQRHRSDSAVALEVDPLEAISKPAKAGSQDRSGTPTERHRAKAGPCFHRTERVGTPWHRAATCRNEEVSRYHQVVFFYVYVFIGILNHQQ